MSIQSKLYPIYQKKCKNWGEGQNGLQFAEVSDTRGLMRIYFAAIIIFANLPAEAQTEKITVVGSRIRQIDVEAPSPIKIIDREEIEKSAHSTVGGVLQTSTLAPYGGSYSRIDVRGMGAGRTLVLVNGKRLPKTGGSHESSATNIAAIPISAVERIETLTDGASAVYGSEALSSVINIVTRKNLDGLSMSILPAIGSLNRSQSIAGSLTYGKNFSRGYFNSSFDWVYLPERYSKDRDYIAPRVLSNTNYSDNYTVSGSDTAAFPNCKELLEEKCAQYHGDISRYGEYYRMSHFSEFHRDLGSGLALNADFMGYYAQGSSYNPAHMNFSSEHALKPEEIPDSWNLADRLNYREGETLEFSHRLKGFEHIVRPHQFSLGGNIGLSGDFIDGEWAWAINNNIAGYREKSVHENSVLIAQSKRVFGEGRYDPFAGVGFASVADEVFYDAVKTKDYFLNIFDLSMDGPIFEGDKGALSLATGLELSYYEYGETSDEHSAKGNVSNFQGIDDAHGERTHQALYAELGGDYSHWLESQLAVRLDRYSDFGSTVNPKLALRLSPRKWLAFRASTGTGFKAPEIADSVGKGFIKDYLDVMDSVACEKNNCRSQKIPVKMEINPSIGPETSFSWNVGMMVEPSSRFNVKMDYWNYRVENVIGLSRINHFLWLQSQGRNPEMEDFGIKSIVRNPNGDIDEIVLFKVVNMGIRRMRGMDVGLGYRFNQKSSLKWDYSLVLEDAFSMGGGEDFYSKLGNYGIPRYRYNLVWDYNFSGDKHLVRLERTTIGRYKNLVKDGIIPEHSQYNVAYRWILEQPYRGELNFKIRNLFNLRPLYDRRGTTYFVTSLYNTQSRYSIEYKIRF